MIKQIDVTRKFEVSRLTIELVFASYLRCLRDLRHGVKHAVDANDAKNATIYSTLIKHANSRFFKSPKDYSSLSNNRANTDHVHDKNVHSTRAYLIGTRTRARAKISKNVS